MYQYIELPSQAHQERAVIPLHYWSVKNPQALLYIVHGMSEHTRSYERLAQYFTGKNIAVMGHDQIGHGAYAKRLKKLGRYEHYEKIPDALVWDLITGINYAHQKCPQKPVILLGNSLGAYVSRLYLKTHSDQVAACFLSATHGHVKSLHLAPILGRILARHHAQIPNYTLHQQLFSQEHLGQTKLTKVQQGWYEREKQKESDPPLAGFVFSNSGFAMMLKLAMQATEKNWAQGLRPDLPLCFMNGESDPMLFRGLDQKYLTQELQAQQQKCVTFMIFAGRGHELFFYHEPEIVFTEMLAWLKRQHILPHNSPSFSLKEV